MILVTGGAGYIGAHVVNKLLNENNEVIVIDNLRSNFNGNLYGLKKINQREFKFLHMDLLNLKQLDEVFKLNSISTIIHFAAYKSIPESISSPIMYYDNNINSTINLLKMSEKYKVKNFVFSSSATVYGNNISPITEGESLNERENPYGETKYICERIIKDTVKATPSLSAVSLRYFNPVGAHSSGLIGESLEGQPDNLMPYITKVANQELDYLRVFGNDYDTIDGTGVRDYIHVEDLATAHLKAVEYNYGKNNNYEVFNIGTGTPTSVLELLKSFEQVNHISIPYQFVNRRDGDVAELYANVNKANVKLNWQAKYSIEDMCRDAWNFEKVQKGII